MESYLYKAVDKNGKKVSGEYLSANEDDLETFLESQGLYLIDAKINRNKTRQKSNKVKRGEIAEFFNGLGALTSSGVTILDALTTIREETENEYFADVIEGLIHSIESGSTLFNAFRLYPGVFSDQISNMVNAGEHSGRMSETFMEISEHLEWVQKIMADIKQASTYPIILLSSVFGLLTVMIVVVVPRFVVVFEDAGIELPASTQYLMTLGDIWWVIAGGLIGAILFIKFFSDHLPILKDIMEFVKFNAPIFGSINRMLTLSMFSHNLSLLLKAGIPLHDSLKICHHIIQSNSMKNSISKAVTAVNEGRKMSDALRNSAMITPLMLRMLRVGEETGSLEKSLHHVSKRLDSEIPRRIKKAFSILEPAITFFMMVTIGVVASAILSPMFKMMSGISG